jgi:hypothetical protein
VRPCSLAESMGAIACVFSCKLQLVLPSEAFLARQDWHDLLDGEVLLASV